MTYLEEKIEISQNCSGDRYIYILWCFVVVLFGYSQSSSFSMVLHCVSLLRFFVIFRYHGSLPRIKT